MNKRLDQGRPDFAFDLGGIQSDVTSDVGKILQLAKSANEGEASSTFTVERNASQPSTRAATHSASPRTDRVRRTATTKQESKELIILENVTTRLRRETNELLTEAALRQRLKKTSPASRQDIIEVALHDWFRKHGYQKGTDASDG